MKTYKALVFQRREDGLYIDFQGEFTSNINYAYFIVNDEGTTPSKDVNDAPIQKLLRKEREREEELEFLGTTQPTNFFKPSLWLKHCDLVETDISESQYYEFTEPYTDVQRSEPSPQVYDV